MAGVKENPNQCENRLGMLEALAKMYTKKFATVDHIACINRGDDICRYIVAWESSPSFFWKKARNYFVLFCFLSASVTLYFLPLLTWTILALSLTVTLSGLMCYANHLEKKELVENITVQGDAAARLLDEINKRYNQVLLVKEIGQATSMILDIDQLLTFAIEALENRLDFDRGMIMLANKDKTRLVFTVGYGYDDKFDKDFLKSVSFSLDNPDSRGVAVLSFKNQMPYLVNDIAEIEKVISPRSLEITRYLGTQSFVCVPIVYKGESMGVLFVDNRTSKRKLTESDMSLLMGIAPQIAISINNALTYKQVQESERRFRSLSENAPDIIYMIDLKANFTYVNPITEKIIGYSADELVGQPYSKFISEDEFNVLKNHFRNVRDGKYVLRDVICRVVHKNGSHRYFSASCAPIMMLRVRRSVF